MIDDTDADTDMQIMLCSVLLWLEGLDVILYLSQEDYSRLAKYERMLPSAGGVTSTASLCVYKD